MRRVRRLGLINPNFETTPAMAAEEKRASSGIFSLPGESLATAIATGIFGVAAGAQQADIEKQRIAYAQQQSDAALQAKISGDVSSQVAAAQSRNFYMKIAAGVAGAALVAGAVYIGYKAMKKR